MKIVSWNVAGFRACLKKGFLSFFENIDADIFCLQEVKATANQYDFHPEGYFEYLYPAERKGYSGTLVFSRIEPIDVRYGIGISKFDQEGRSITLEYDQFYLVNFYVPNVKRSLERMDERMEWETRVQQYLHKLDQEKPVIVCGDFNVAHTEIDIKNAKQNIGNAGFTYEEREKFTELLEKGFIDTFRYYHPEEKDHYTWWSYMKDVRKRNIGWRIDYFLVSKRFIGNIKDTMIYSEIYGSDHCPIGIEVEE
ncbi:MAG: exodeoxyribonuclease III [Bacilli bacterium]|nr:exodeoxyribonuclease III [Bacilli bacterium]